MTNDGNADKKRAHLRVTTSIHHLAICESDEIGEGTRVWAFAHVMKGAKVGSDCNIGEGVFIESGAQIGDRVTVKNQVMIWDGVRIEDDVFIGPGVVFTNDMWPRSPRMPEAIPRYRDPVNWRRETEVRRGASLGAAAVILPAVSVGEYAMIGAGSVVTRDVEPHELVVGNPARPIGWVCTCGNRLDHHHTCEGCSAHYQLINERLTPLHVLRPENHRDRPSV